MSELSQRFESLSQQLEEIRLMLNNQSPEHRQVPDGWGGPSNDIDVAQRQYVDAAWSAESLSKSLSTIVDDWKNVLVKPKAIDALFMAAHAVIKRVSFDLESTGDISHRTAELVRSYLAATVSQDVALTELVKLSSKIVQHGVATNDPIITNVASNLLAANLIDLVVNPVDAPLKTT